MENGIEDFGGRRVGTGLEPTVARNRTFFVMIPAVALLSLLGGCGGGGGGGGGAPATFLMGGAIQGTALNLTTAVTTLAGNGTAAFLDNATGTMAEFNDPVGVTTDGANLYVADQSNHRIRKIVIATGAVTTVAGDGTAGFADNPNGALAEFKAPFGVTTDGTNLYVADTNNHRIRKIAIATGAVTTVAGDGTASFADNPNGALAEFNFPAGITTDGSNLYVADTNNHRIRKIAIATGAVTTVAGNGTNGFADNATGTMAEFFFPFGVTTDGTNLYVADEGNQRIRKIAIATGAVTTVAGDGTAGFADNPNGALAEFSNPIRITTDGTNLYVADRNNHRIRKIVIATGAVTTVAGNGTAGFADNPNGALAEFNIPIGMTTDGTNLYVADQGNQRIRKIQ
jgi:NHL repeat